MCEYQVGISYAVEDVEIVEKVVTALRQKNLDVFFDLDKKADFVGKNLNYYLRDIFLNQCQYCMMFISSAYVQKKWTTFESDVLMEKRTQSRVGNPYIDTVIPVRIDDTLFDGFSSDIVCFDIRKQTPEEIAIVMAKKISTNPINDHLSSSEKELSVESILSEIYSNVEQFFSSLSMVTHELKRESPWDIIMQLRKGKNTYSICLSSNPNIASRLIKIYESHTLSYKKADICDAEVYLENNKMYFVNFIFTDLMPAKPVIYTSDLLCEQIIHKLNTFVKENQYV